MNISASGCENNPGPTITFDGELSLTRVNVRFIFRNNVKGTHTAEVSTGHAVIIPSEAQSVSITCSLIELTP